MAALDAAQMRSWSERRDWAEEDGEGQRFRGGGKVEERRTRERIGDGAVVSPSVG